LGEEFVPFEGDVREPEDVVAAVREAAPRAVVHLAAISSVGESWQRSAETWMVNAVGTVNVIDALVGAAPEARLLFVSTGEVYGRAAETPTSEAAPFAPLSPYAASKVAAEIAAGQAARSAGLDIVVARPFQHEGPGRGDRFAIGSWTRQIAELELRGGGELLVGDLSPERDITDVRDDCRAYELLLDQSVEAGTYNIASGTSVALDDVVQMLVELARAPISVVTDESRFRPSDLPLVLGDSSKLRAATGWAPKIPLRETLSDALDYAREVVDRENVAKA
jgi:GDP-4-dehydro-6-deoxy-D-mannose reductase